MASENFLVRNFLEIFLRHHRFIGTSFITGPPLQGPPTGVPCGSAQRLWRRRSWPRAPALGFAFGFLRSASPGRAERAERGWRPRNYEGSPRIYYRFLDFNWDFLGIPILVLGFLGIS